eukprot:m.886526 g.886526  ORF g.886526 m.886526 type:complete len:891 (-) comp23626_c1_seq2:1034-3706(-)
MMLGSPGNAPAQSFDTPAASVMPLSQAPIDARHDDATPPEFVKMGRTLFLDGNIHLPCIVKYIGGTHFNKKGTWIGIALREPIGDCGGMRDGRRYFSCKPKHGMFVRAYRLLENYTTTDKPSTLSTTEKKSVVAPKSSVHGVVQKKKSVRRHPTLDKACGSAQNSKRKNRPIRYYIDPQGRRFTTLKETDPYGNPTHLVETTPEPTGVPMPSNVSTTTTAPPPPQPSAPVTAATPPPAVVVVPVVAPVNAIPIAPAAPPHPAETVQPPVTAVATPVPTAETTRPPPKVTPADPHSTGFSDDEGAEDEDGPNAWFWKMTAGSDGGKSASGAIKPTSSKRVGQMVDQVLGESSMEVCRQLASELRTASIAENWAYVRDLLCDQAAALTVTEKTLRESGVGKVVGKLRKSSNPAVAFAAEDVIDGWKFQIKLEVKRKSTVDARPATLTRSADSEQDEMSDSGQRGKRSTQRAPSRQQRTRGGDLTAGSSTTPNSDDAIDTDGDDNTEQATGKTTQQSSKATRARRAPGRSPATTARSGYYSASDSGAENADGPRKPLIGERKSRARGRTGATDAGASGSKASNEHTDNDGLDSDDVGDVASDSGESETDEDILGESFIALSILDRCLLLMKRIKKLTLAEDWLLLLELLRSKVAPLLVTEDALRRSGIGRVLHRIAKHVDNKAVATQADEILLDWKSRMGHRDPAAELAHQAESLERAKFAEFMSLEPIPLTSWAVGVGKTDDVDRTTVRRAAGPKYYEKQLVIKRGMRKQPLGFEMKMSVPVTGGTAAVIESVNPTGIAARSGREGCSIEVGDEIVSICGTYLANCTMDETMQLLKTDVLDIKLRAIIPGSDSHDVAIGGDDDDTSEAAGLYQTSGLSVFHKVLPNDYVTID